MFNKKKKKLNYIYLEEHEIQQKNKTKLATLIIVLAFLFIFILIAFWVITRIKINKIDFKFDSSSQYEITDLKNDYNHMVYKIDFANRYVIKEEDLYMHKISWISMSKKSLKRLEELIKEVVSNPDNKELSNSEKQQLKQNGNVYIVYTYDQGKYYFKDVEKNREFEKLVRYNMFR